MQQLRDPARDWNARCAKRVPGKHTCAQQCLALVSRGVSRARSRVLTLTSCSCRAVLSVWLSASSAARVSHVSASVVISSSSLGTAWRSLGSVAMEDMGGLGSMGLVCISWTSLWFI